MKQKIIQRVSSVQAASAYIPPASPHAQKKAQMAIEMEKQITYYQLI